jgi:hypothetical protein
MIQHLTKRELKQRAVGVESSALLDAGLRALDVARLAFPPARLQQRADVVAVVLQQARNSSGRVRACPSNANVRPSSHRARGLRDAREDAPELRVFEYRNSPVLKYAISRLPRATCICPSSSSAFINAADRLLVQSLVVIQDAEVVVRPASDGSIRRANDRSTSRSRST